MVGLLGLLFASAVMLSGAAAGSSTPAPQRMGPFHWHVTFGGKKRFYLEYQHTNRQGHPVYQCPFSGCDTIYVKRPRRR